MAQTGVAEQDAQSLPAKLGFVPKGVADVVKTFVPLKEAGENKRKS